MDMKLILCLILSCYSVVNSSIIINRYDDNECVLTKKLADEIESYKHIAVKIMNDIKTKELGQTMYERYKEFIDKFGARPSGTVNLENAIDHMINLTKSMGIHDITTEELDVPHWVRVEESAKMIQPRLKNIAILGFGTSVSTPTKGLTAEAIIVKSFQEFENLTNQYVSGKIVVFNAKYSSYGETVIYRTQGASKAAMKGAVASLVRSITPFSLYTPHTGAQYYTDNVTKIPTAAITLEDADLLERLQSMGEKIVIHLKMLYTYDWKKSRNTIVDLKGNKHPEKSVIVSGHIDSWDVGQGAMDDGGGMFISWFVPIALNHFNLKPKRTVRAILWTSEEPGLIGAQDYLKKHENDLKNINFIMESDEGTFKPLGLGVAGSKEARCIIERVLKLFKPIDKMEETNYPGSDITLIVNKGVPGATLLNENERYYWYHHSEADTMDIQNQTNVLDCAAFWTSFTYVIASLSEDIPRK